MAGEHNRIVGLIGLGYWGKNILRNLNELGVLHTACDYSSEIIAQRKSEFPGILYTNRFEELLEQPEIKAVTIATPAATHYGLSRRALLADKDVFVEKPLSLTYQEGQQLVELAHQQKKILMVGHLLQYHPAVIVLHDLIAKGTLGSIQYIYSNRLNIGKLRTEENVLWSFAPHDISVILMLVGEEPSRVFAFGGAYVNRGIVDTTLTTLEFSSSGIRGHIFVNWLHPYKEQKLVVVGSNAMAVFDDCAKDKLTVYPHTIEIKDGHIPVAHKAEGQAVPLTGQEPLTEELRHFINCVNQRTVPKTDGREALRVLSVLEKATMQLTHNIL
ncbi:MAG: oxidoreductase [Deltaproteobacteria bacterium RIFCSPLOWO2_02_FULL_46_8]|nr:MAG: oxidoreductase [Deltaproteobacteria bacterium RIFCSPLOWO2_02_FULL_46_8]